MEILSWNLSNIEYYINNSVKENISTEYKRSSALDRNKIHDICKDISSFANSAGGIIIYGIIEENSAAKSIDEGFDTSKFTIESLEQMLNHHIRQRLRGVIFKQINLSVERAILVVYIPQAVENAPHQAPDGKYYKRHNMTIEPMYDYEIRDAMRRGSVPSVSIEFLIDDILYSNGFVEFNISSVLSNDSECPALYFTVHKHVSEKLSVKNQNLYALSSAKQFMVGGDLIRMNTYYMNCSPSLKLPIFREINSRMESIRVMSSDSCAESDEFTFYLGGMIATPGSKQQRFARVTIRMGICKIEYIPILA